VVISDLHLGASNARPADVLRFFDEVRVDQLDHLVVNGDLFDRPSLADLATQHVRVAERLAELARCGVRVSVLLGNHDPEPCELRSLLTGCDLQLQRTIACGGKRYLVCHGDRWDRSLSWPSLIVHGADYVYRLSQRIDPTHRLARALKHRCKWFVRATTEVRRRAVEHARVDGYDGVIVGHTHAAVDETFAGVRYLNSGCWTERPMGYVRFGDDVPDGAELHLWTPPSRAFFSRRPSIPHVPAEVPTT
jgi:UDP-2,3-diacylglucosamine pyrophosphatase LpxH